MRYSIIYPQENGAIRVLLAIRSVQTVIHCFFVPKTMWTKKDTDLLLVNITVHLDILGYSIVLPIMASLSQSLGGNVTHTSYLFSCYAITQLISCCLRALSPIGYLYMGRVSDRYGRKSMLILSLIGSCVGIVFHLH